MDYRARCSPGVLKQVNLDKLWSLVSEQTREYYADKKVRPLPKLPLRISHLGKKCGLSYSIDAAQTENNATMTAEEYNTKRSP